MRRVTTKCPIFREACEPCISNTHEVIDGTPRRLVGRWLVARAIADEIGDVVEGYDARTVKISDSITSVSASRHVIVTPGSNSVASPRSSLPRTAICIVCLLLTVARMPSRRLIARGAITRIAPLKPRAPRRSRANSRSEPHQQRIVFRFSRSGRLCAQSASVPSGTRVGTRTDAGSEQGGARGEEGGEG